MATPAPIVNIPRAPMGAGPVAASIEEPRGFYGAAPGEFELAPRLYWPTTIFSRKYRDHAKDAPSIIDHLQEMKAAQKKNIESNVAPTMKSEHGLFESKFDLFETTTHEPLKRLIGFIESSVKRAVWHVNGRSVDVNRIRVKFVDSWFHITNGAGFHDAHYHGGCSWCGIYYLQISDVPANLPSHAPNGVNRFYGPIPHGGLLSDYGNHYLGAGHVDVPPSPGTLVIFPAYLLHSGLPYSGAQDRVILSFNSSAELLPPTT
ncbi:MAG: putative 2OG-Fe(II) oxygenase [Phycisphaerales bacterium]